MLEPEKRQFRDWLRRLETFSGVQVLTYCLMENHFHLLVRVPNKHEMPALTAHRLRELLPVIYQGRELRGAIQELDQAAASSSPVWLAELLARYDARRFSLSIFLKELKQRYTRWHNRRHRRTGTLWEDRFRSVLVEGDENALLTTAAYIDLNAIRAGIVADPKDYHWCGYAEAVSGQKPARKGLSAILEHTTFGINRRVTWASVGPRYRVLLYGYGEKRDADPKTGAAARPGMSQEQVEAEIERGGRLSKSEILQCRIRYLSESIAIGSSEFLSRVFEENRERFGKNRTTAGKPFRGADWGGLQTLKKLGRDPFA
jgi:REP element-mobilizing transposase RayT